MIEVPLWRFGLAILNSALLIGAYIVVFTYLND